jgi:hypothetical protein
MNRYRAARLASKTGRILKISGCTGLLDLSNNVAFNVEARRKITSRKPEKVACAHSALPRASRDGVLLHNSHSKRALNV